LLRRGYEVVPFVRPTADLRAIKKLGLPCQFGDVLDYPSLLKGAQGCDVIIHHATVFHLWARNPNDILKPAVKGQEYLQSSQEIGAGRMIYTSSMAAVGYHRNPNGRRTETDWNEHA
jgi:dihydroflavonol-4-reductase